MRKIKKILRVHYWYVDERGKLFHSEMETIAFPLENLPLTSIYRTLEMFIGLKHLDWKPNMFEKTKADGLIYGIGLDPNSPFIHLTGLELSEAEVTYGIKSIEFLDCGEENENETDSN